MARVGGLMQDETPLFFSFEGTRKVGCRDEVAASDENFQGREESESK